MKSFCTLSILLVFSSLSQAQPNSYLKRWRPISYRVIEMSSSIDENEWDATILEGIYSQKKEDQYLYNIMYQWVLPSKFSNYQSKPPLFNVDSMLEFGILYAGDPTESNARTDSISAFWYQKAALLGHPEGQTRLGWRYQQGKGIAKNDSMAFFWYQKAAFQEDPEAQSHLGWLYEYGKGVTQNDSIAVFWYQKAADIGHDEARNRLGWMYEQGKGVPQDSKKALYWYQEAACQNNLNALIHLGQLYETGKGIPKNAGTAFNYYNDAAQQGDEVAQNHLGHWYETALPPAMEKALYWYETAAHQGNAAAQKNLSRLYRTGKGVPQHPVMAAFWFQKAEHQQDTLFKNQGQEVSYNTAVYLSHLKAAAGNAQGMASLAYRYAFGKGILKNDSLAQHWYQKMADKGYSAGQIALDSFHQTGHWKDVRQNRYVPHIYFNFNNQEYIKPNVINRFRRKITRSKQLLFVKRKINLFRRKIRNIKYQILNFKDSL
ncbi:MAG: putative beta-lactamase hcpD precursor [Bacteroidota bacterium]